MLDFITGNPITPEQEEEERRRRKLVELGLISGDEPDLNPEFTPPVIEDVDLKFDEGPTIPERPILDREPDPELPTPEPAQNPFRGSEMALSRRPAQILDFLRGALPPAEEIAGGRQGSRSGTSLPFPLPAPMQPIDNRGTPSDDLFGLLDALPPSIGPVAAGLGTAGKISRVGLNLLGGEVVDQGGEFVARQAARAARRIGEMELGLADDLGMTPAAIRQARGRKAAEDAGVRSELENQQRQIFRDRREIDAEGMERQPLTDEGLIELMRSRSDTPEAINAESLFRERAAREQFGRPLDTRYDQRPFDEHGGMAVPNDYIEDPLKAPELVATEESSRQFFGQSRARKTKASQAAAEQAKSAADDAQTYQAAWDIADDDLRTNLHTTFVDISDLDESIIGKPWAELDDASRTKIRNIFDEVKSADAVDAPDFEPSAADINQRIAPTDPEELVAPPVTARPKNVYADLAKEPLGDIAETPPSMTPKQRMAAIRSQVTSIPEEAWKGAMMDAGLDEYRGAYKGKEPSAREKAKMAAQIDATYNKMTGRAETPVRPPRATTVEPVVETIDDTLPAAPAVEPDVPAPRPGLTPNGQKFLDDIAAPMTENPKLGDVTAPLPVRKVLTENGIPQALVDKATIRQAIEHLQALDNRAIEPLPVTTGGGKKPPKPPKKTASMAEPEPPTPREVPLEEGEEIIDDVVDEVSEFTDRPEFAGHPLAVLRKLYPDTKVINRQTSRYVTLLVKDADGNDLIAPVRVGKGKKTPWRVAAEEAYDKLKAKGIEPQITDTTKMQRVKPTELPAETVTGKKVDPEHPYKGMKIGELQEVVAQRRAAGRDIKLKAKPSWTDVKNALEADDMGKSVDAAKTFKTADTPDLSTPKTDTELETVLKEDVAAETGVNPNDPRNMPNMKASDGIKHLKNVYKDTTFTFNVGKTKSGTWYAKAYQGAGPNRTLEMEGIGKTSNEAMHDLQSKMAAPQPPGETPREFAVRNNIPEIVSRLAATLRSKDLVTLQKGQELIRTKENAARFKAAAQSLQGKKGLEAYFGSLKKLGGELTAIELDNLLLTKEEADLLSEYMRLRAVPKTDEAVAAVLYTTYANAHHSLLKVLTGKIPTAREASRLTEFFGPEIRKALESHDPWWMRQMRLAYETSLFPRAIVAAGDLSWGLRQGFPLIRNKEYWKFQGEMLQKFLSKGKMSDYADDVQASIEAHPMFGRGKAMGLYLSQGYDDTDEAVNSVISGMWGIGRTNDAFRAVDNNVRWNMFYRLSDRLEKAGVDINTEDGLNQYKTLADYLNYATGRGKLPDWQKVNRVFSGLFFAPRFFVSRPQLAGKTFMTLRPGSPAHKILKQQVAGDLVASYGAVIGALTALKVYSMNNPESDTDVELDPRSSDFGKFRVGSARVDVFGGYQPLARFIGQSLTQETKTLGTGEVSDANFGDTFLRFARSKLNIGPGQLLDNMSGETYTGKPLNDTKDRVLHLIRSTLLPMTVNQIFEIGGNSGLKNMWLAPLAAAGASAGDITPDEEKVPGLYEYRAADSVAADLAVQALYTDPKERARVAQDLVKMAKRNVGNEKNDAKDQVSDQRALLIFNRLVTRFRNDAKNQNPQLLSHLIANKQSRGYEPNIDVEPEKEVPTPRYVKPPEDIEGSWSSAFTTQFLTEWYAPKWNLISPNGKKPIAYNQLEAEPKKAIDDFRAKLNEATYTKTKGQVDDWAKLPIKEKQAIWKSLPAPTPEDKSEEKKLKEKSTELYKSRPTDRKDIREAVNRVNPPFMDSVLGGMLKEPANSLRGFISGGN